MSMQGHQASREKEKQDRYVTHVPGDVCSRLNWDVIDDVGRDELDDALPALDVRLADHFHIGEADPECMGNLILTTLSALDHPR